MTKYLVSCPMEAMVLAEDEIPRVAAGAHASLVDRFGRDRIFHGFPVQLPLPWQVDPNKVIVRRRTRISTASRHHA